MKHLGKIGLAAGLAATIFVLLRKRKDGTRLLDDINYQLGSWTDQLMEWKDRLGDEGKASVSNGAQPRTAPRTSPVTSGRQPGDIQE